MRLYANENIVKISCDRVVEQMFLANMRHGIYSLSFIYPLFLLIWQNCASTIILKSKGLTGVPPLNTTITTLNLRNNSIAKLGPYELLDAPELTKLVISENLLTYVDELAFYDTLIWKLDLTGNNLTEIPNLGCLKNTMMSLEVASNKIEYLRETSLQLLNHLNYLDLNNNRLLRIDYNSFCGTILKTVNLNHNFIGTVPNFSCLGNLIENVYMKGNRIRNITRGAFTGILSNKLYIYFTDNHLSDVSLLSGMSDFSAPQLMLDSNNITCITSVSTRMIKLKILI